MEEVREQGMEEFVFLLCTRAVHVVRGYPVAGSGGVVKASSLFKKASKKEQTFLPGGLSAPTSASNHWSLARLLFTPPPSAHNNACTDA